jgi:recombination protein RecA
MSVAQDVEALLARLPRLDSSNKLRVGSGKGVSPPLVLSWPGLEEVLPDGGLPRGVVELAAPRALGGSTSIALAAVRAGQERSGGAWCAWIDPERTLYAPGVVAAGVDLTRMLVVCPPRVDLGRASVKLVCAGAFEVVVVDFDAISGVRGRNTGVGAGKRRALSPEVLVRKLALAAEPSGTTVLLLTDATRARAVPWPVTLRLELTRPSRRDLSVYIAKDRFGRVGFAKTIPFRPLMRAAG